MSQHPPTKRLILSSASCIPQLPSLEGCSLTLTVLNRSALGSHRGGCNINYSVAAGVLTWGTAPAENGISAQELTLDCIISHAAQLLLLSANNLRLYGFFY